MSCILDLTVLPYFMDHNILSNILILTLLSTVVDFAILSIVFESHYVVLCSVKK